KRDVRGRTLPVWIVRGNREEFGIGRRRRAQRNVATLRWLFSDREPDQNMVRNGRAIRGVVQVDGDITSRLHQLSGMKIAIIGNRVSGQIAVFRHAAETAIWRAGTESRPLPRNRASLIVARLIVPVRLEILDAGVMRIEAQTHVMRNLAVLRPDLHRG